MMKSLMVRFTNPLLMLALSVMAFVPSGFAHEGHDGKECSNALKIGHTEVVLSAREHPETIAKLKKDIELLYGENGILRRLGIRLPPHVVEMMPSADLAVLATLGRHAQPHWHDGQSLAREVLSAMGVMEFVTPGCPTCRSFYSDMTEYIAQRLVLMHVGGHNDFAALSRFNLVRDEDPIATSLELFEKIKQYKRRYGADIVDRFYQQILSLSGLQDLTRGTFQEPSKFKVAPEGVFTNHPKQPTRSVLQAMVENLPQSAAEWKTDMLSTFERMERVLGYYASCKIMNEGWAMMVEELATGHGPLEWRNQHNTVEFAEATAGTVQPSFGNPYWMGREAWRRVRERFEAQPEIQGLPPFERDQKFVEHAHHFIEQYDDYQFLRYAFDEVWIKKHKLYLKRKALEEDFEGRDVPPIPPRQSEQDQALYTVMRSGWEETRDWIVSRVADRARHLPEISLVNLNAFGRGVVQFKHTVRHNAPLEQHSAALTLYVLSQVFERAVSIDTVIYVEPKPPKNENGWRQGDWLYDFDTGEWVYSPIPRPYLQDVRMEVTASGHVKVSKLSPKGSKEAPQAMRELSEALTQQVQVYAEDSATVYDERLYGVERQKFAPFMESIVHHNLDPAMQMVSHAPTAASALLEYANALNARMPRLLRLLKEGKLPYIRGAKGIRFRALPNIPEFKLDLKAQKKIWDAQEPTPFRIDPTGRMVQVMPLKNAKFQAASTRSQSGYLGVPIQAPQSVNGFFRASSDDLSSSINGFQANNNDVGIGVGDHQPGDLVWGPDPRQGGPGEEEGEPGKPSEDDKDLVEIPFDVYGKLLEEEIELPNLKPKAGETDLVDRVREGGIQRPNGQVLYERMMNKILALGKKALQNEKDEKKKKSKLEMYKRGLRMLEPSDHIVVNFEETPVPDMQAVVVFNMDMSGSMSGEPYEILRELLFHLKVLLHAKYKNVVFRYVGFSGEAREFKTEKEFFSSFIGGGTQYTKGLELSKKILDTYPEPQWDRFLITGGDLEDVDGPGAVRMLKELTEILQYNAVVFTKVRGDQAADQTLLNYSREQGKEKYYGHAEVESRDPDASRQVIRTLFPKNKGSSEQ